MEVAYDLEVGHYQYQSLAYVPQASRR